MHANANNLASMMLRRPLSDGTDSAQPEFILQMQTTSPSESITLPMTGAVSVDIDWGDGTVESVATDSPSHTFASAGTYEVKITGTCNLFSFNNSGDRLKLLAVLNGGAGFTVGSWAGGFFGCSNMTSADFAGLDTSSVTDMVNMFRGCSGLVSLDVTGFDTSIVTDMSFMLRNCSSLTSLDVTGFDTSSVGNMSSMFLGCSSLTADPGIGSFDVTALDVATDMCSGANAMLSEAEYNTILVNWEAQAVNDSVAVHFGDAVYSGAGATARAALIADHSWTITDGGAA